MARNSTLSPPPSVSICVSDSLSPLSLTFSCESLLGSHSYSLLHPSLLPSAPCSPRLCTCWTLPPPLFSFPISLTPCSPFSLPLYPSPSLSVSPSLWLPGICLVSSTNNIWAIDHPGHRGGREAAVEERSSSCHRDWVEVGAGATLPVLRKGI